MYNKLNNDWIAIEYVEDEHDENRDFEPSFWFENRRYFLNDFVRCHNNPFIGYDDFPEYIHAYEADEYFHPLFIELDESGENVNVYREK